MKITSFSVTNISNDINALKESPNRNALESLLSHLNDIFEDMHAKCIDIIYTKNTDGMPFGVYVFPVLSDKDVKDFLINGELFHVDKYKVEIDGRMFMYDMTSQEITAIMINNIYNMVNGTIPVEQMRNAIDAYFAKTGTSLQIRESIEYQKILELGLIDTLIKFTNCLYLDSDVVSNPIMASLELESDFESALHTLFDRIPGCDNSASRSPKLIILEWCFHLYTDLEHERMPAMKQLHRSSDLTPSYYYKKIFDDLTIAINKIIINVPYSVEVFESAITVLEEGKKGSLFSQIKYNGLRGIEDDFYEFMVRARNAETEEEVMYALKQINVRLSILDDYIRHENLSPEEKERWTTLYIKYCDIRDEIAKKKVYNKKNYGIFFDYNQLDKDDE